MDNLFKQIVASNKEIIAMGDSVWMEIYPFKQNSSDFDHGAFDVKVTEDNMTTLISKF